MTKKGESEAMLYENIVSIPHYHSKYMQLLDKEEEKDVVKENFPKFQQMYHPILNAHFKDCFSVENG